MKHSIRLLTFVAILLGLALPATAQSNLNTTTLSAAVTATQNTVVVASATGITAKTTSLWLPATGELMRVRAVSSTTITVDRGGGTGAHQNAASATVVVVPDEATINGPSGTLFGSCTGANARRYYQILNPDQNVLYVCMLGGTWQGRQGTPLVVNHTLVITR